MRTEAEIKARLEYWRGIRDVLVDAYEFSESHSEIEEISLGGERYLQAQAIIGVLEWCLRESAPVTTEA